MSDDMFYVDTPGEFKVYKVQKLEDLLLFLRKLQDPFRFIFRGQENSDWMLETKIERGIPENYKRIVGLQGCESAVLQQFKRRAHHYLSPLHIPAEDNDLEWLALIQHYGGPTRLLDFTRSIFVAAYFAIGTRNKYESAAIWAINHDYMGQNLRHVRRRNRCQVEGDLLSASLRGHCSYPAAIRMEPFRQNRRLLQQQGLFIMPLDINQLFMENLAVMFRPIPSFDMTDVRPSDTISNLDDCSVIKFVICKEDYPQLCRDLRQMNIATEILFPDLEGEARATADIITNHVFVKGVL